MNLSDAEKITLQGMLFMMHAMYNELRRNDLHTKFDEYLGPDGVAGDGRLELVLNHSRFLDDGNARAV